MRSRTLKIVKRTPIALAVCEACDMEFHSQQQIEDDAEKEMKALFDSHECALDKVMHRIEHSGDID
jgi:hypothetical protein